MDFQDLLQDAEQMTAQIDQENVGMPKLQRTLSQLYEAGRKKLASAGNFATNDTTEINASILLAAKGIDAPKLTQNIQNLQSQIADTSHMTATSESNVECYDRATIMDKLKETDLETFLKSEKEAALMSIIEETNRRSFETIEDTFVKSDQSEWEAQKQKIMLELLGSFNPEYSISTATTINSRSSKSTHSMQQKGRTLMSDIELDFAREIYIYNEKCIEQVKPRPDIMLDFVELVRKLNDKNVEEAWQMLNCMSDMSKSDHIGAGGDRVQQQQKQQHTVIDRDNSVNTQRHFVSQAIRYLENCFKDLLQSSVNANLKQAKLGGALGTQKLVSGYLRLAQSEKFYQTSEERFDDNQPLWPTIYLCLRCGDIEAARSVASKTKKDDIVSYLDEIIRSAASSGNLMQRRLSVSSENKLKLDYKGRIKRINDLYKKAVYCYLSRYNGEDDSMNHVLDSVEDFLWFKLNLVVLTGNTQQPQTSSGATTYTTLENMTYQEFQTKLSIEYGERHFITNRNPFIYLQVLLLTAQFELAIEFLLKYESMIVHAVHMAIALSERNMLNITKMVSNSQLICAGNANEPKCLRRINFAGLIKLYTRKFECTDPREALQYYFLLRHMNIPSVQDASSNSIDSKHQSTTTYFAQYIKELALETREFDLLFGKLEKNAIRRPGAIDRFISESDASDIIALVADELESKGLIEESIKLFDLCKQYQRVLELCNKLVSQIVTDASIQNSSRDRLKTMAASIAIRYKTETSMTNSVKAIPKSIVTTFYLLNDLITFFDLFHSENWNLAYETLNKLSILPTTSSNVDPKVKEFIAFSEEIKRNFPDLILAAMVILNTLYCKANVSSNSMGVSKFLSPMNINNEKRTYLNQLREHAKALIKFVGCIPYRLSGEINARLLQLEVTMN